MRNSRGRAGRFLSDALAAARAGLPKRAPVFDASAETESLMDQGLAVPGLLQAASRGLL